MKRRFVSIWFRHLTTDWFSRQQPHLRDTPFVLRAPSHGRMIITATNAPAKGKGIDPGMVLADARAIMPSLHVLDDRPDLPGKLLKRIAEWCVRFTPVAGVDPPDGVVLEATGCTHLWGGDYHYLAEIMRKLNTRGYDVRAAIADTIGSAWAVARFGKEPFVIASDMHRDALKRLPPEGLRLEEDTVDRLHKLGLHTIEGFMTMPRLALRRRFGQHFLNRLDQAMGLEEEGIQPVKPIEPYQERLPCLEPIVTATGIEIALDQLLNALCSRLRQEQKGLRVARFKGYRVDGRVEAVTIETNRPSYNVKHLFKLFEIKLSTIEPDLGIELFTLEAPKVEDHTTVQEKLWERSGGIEEERLSELIDRLGGRLGMNGIHRYLPDEHYWPERSIKPALSLLDKLGTEWRVDRPRPLQLLATPERIEVTAPIPDYPPMLFRYKGQVHTVVKADGPERIEQEWWLERGQHRDYYSVEDEEGRRYWLFRLGHYHEKTDHWFIHGFFA